VPLGSTEQHGAHLPFGTDTCIADALAARFCARVPEALRLPALAIGCSAEHLAFPGTLDLRVATLRAILRDVLASLARHGFACAFVFSAHGGNYGALRTALPALAAACAPMRLVAYTDLDALTAAFHAMSGAYGVGAEASGHHAGELETSIMRALHPRAVRGDALAPGFVEPTNDPQALFYPSLRGRAPSGVVGDPRGATAARGERYLDGWVELLVAAYRRENPSPYTKGTHSA
jgi:creatinine amidohydrolase